MLKKSAALLALLYSSAVFAVVDVNKATEAELDGIRGIGPAMSSRILQERQKAAFKDWADLQQRVQGIGEKNAAKLSAEGLRVQGSKYSAGRRNARRHTVHSDTTAQDKALQPPSTQGQ